ncbi:MAG: aminotransferase class III-fold pyridoxal phosphate-dependent enzyme [Hydrogenophaga sp.]|nr:aminotransferase class III-fold pyridoxal phosphate-dependent enzyme [Hydrogenophaga sp.]
MSTEWVLSAGALAAAFPWLHRRLLLSRAKHRSLAGHSRLAKRLARWVPGYSYGEAHFFGADGAPASVAAQRRAGFFRLSATLQGMAPQGLALTTQARAGLPDLQFTGRYRVPFQFSELVRQHLPLPAFWEHADGVSLSDLDGNRFHDLTGSYGVNVFGVDFYKATMAEGAALGATLGPVLGGYHPCVADNVARLKSLSGMDAVSFHMSGTEAVMQAVRLARYHTGRKRLVRFCGAYHGWWDDVQPGPGNPMPPGHTLTLKDMDERALQVLRTQRDIACVLVNPLQALHPNRNAPGDSTLVSARQSTPATRAAYTEWLQRLRAVCTERGIALIFDEVFVGFRLARGGAQAHYGVLADFVTYGKTLGGGLPVGVVCGRAAWMQRYRPDRPADICFARGTFNAHPYVMGAMNAFLRRLDTDEVRALYEGLDERWQQRLNTFNQGLQRADVPVRVAALSSIWTVNFTAPSRYHWMLQFYLREQGLALSWVGTGRLVFTLAHTDDDMADIQRRFVLACQQMRGDGWWTVPAGKTGRDFGRQILKEMWRAR